MTHLDTSFLIRALVRGSSEAQRLRVWLETAEELEMSAVAWAEFLCGPVSPAHVGMVERIVPLRLSLEEQDATAAARLFRDSGRRSGSLADCMIAATAIRREAQLATVNVRDFRPFERAGLRLAKVEGL